MTPELYLEAKKWGKTKLKSWGFKEGGRGKKTDPIISSLAILGIFLTIIYKMKKIVHMSIIYE